MQREHVLQHFGNLIFFSFSLFRYLMDDGVYTILYTLYLFYICIEWQMVWSMVCAVYIWMGGISLGVMLS